jgi:hypothetical protein
MKIDVLGCRVVVRSVVGLVNRLRRSSGAVHRADWPSVGGQPTRTFIWMGMDNIFRT